MSTCEKRFIPLAEAAQRLGRSWAQMYNLILTRRLEARQERNGRWFVLERDVDAIAEQRASA